MKLKIITAVIIVLTILSGCKKVNEFTQFTIEYDESAIIKSYLGISLPFDVFTPDIETNSASKFESNDTRKDKIQEIKLTKLNLTLTSPSSGDFSFLKTIDVFISADGLDEIRIAWATNISETVGKFLELSVSDVDFKEYIKKDDFSLRLKTVTDKAITTDHELDIHSEFFVDAEILGV